MRILGLVPYPLDTAPGQRYRWEQWAPYLRDRGIEIAFVPFSDTDLANVLYRPGYYGAKALGMLRGLTRRCRDAFSASAYDAVLVQREASLVGPAWFERLARTRGRPIIYDFDDAVWLRYLSPVNRHLSYLKAPSKTRALCRMASTVVAGSDYLAGYARRYSDNVHVVPSTVSLASYRPRSRRRPGPLTVGWTGSHSSAQHLQAVFGALRRLSRRVEFRFLVIGAEVPAIGNVDLECRPWNAAREVEDIWDMDVGIMPLPDEPWARGKCGMKAIQYMGAGIPAVVSPVGVNTQIVAHGETGLYARSEDDWVDGLERLLRDESCRREMGTRAREHVERHYSAESQVPRVAEILGRL